MSTKTKRRTAREYTAAEAARALGCCKSRVNQICAEFGIGTMFGKQRRLVDADLDKIRVRLTRIVPMTV